MYSDSEIIVPDIGLIESKFSFGRSRAECCLRPRFIRTLLQYESFFEVCFLGQSLTNLKKRKNQFCTLSADSFQELLLGGNLLEERAKNLEA